MSPQKIAISANFTIEPILPTMQEMLGKVEIRHEIEIAPYNQIFQQLLDSSGSFHDNLTGVNVIFLRLEDLINRGDDRAEFSQSDLEQIRSIAFELTRAFECGENYKVPLYIFLCPASAAIADDAELSTIFGEIELTMVAAIGSLSNVYFFPASAYFSRYPVKNYDNPKGYALGKIPYTEQFYSALAIELVRKLSILSRKPYKVLALDCDNTLWTGVCGEDGTDGISFCDSRISLQNFAVEQSKAGMLICLCSKNNEEAVWDVFEKRHEMPLKREHIVGHRINWELKSSNLRALSDELQLGLDSFVFIDDDPVICAEVQQNCPEVLTVLLPSKLTSIPALLDHLWIFDRLKVTDEDRDRSNSYKREAERRIVQEQSPDFNAFLESLELVCDIAPVRPETISRVSQLSLRTNQFNSTTIRRSESEMRDFLKDDANEIYTIDVRDRFGDYGLVGVVMCRIDPDAINVESFMLSCRVLGRGVEHRIVRELAQKATDAARRFVRIEYRQTDKNVPIRNFLNDIGEEYKVDSGEKILFELPVEAASMVAPKSRAATKIPKISAAVRDQNTDTKEGWAELHAAYFEIAASLANRKWDDQVISRHDVSRELLETDFTSPRTQIETRLCSIWESHLKATGIGIHDDFFKLGGDSLLAVSIFVNIEDEFGLQLPLSALIESPTIAKLSGLIEAGKTGPSSKYLVPIQSNGTQRPLFCMHAAGGNVLFYRDLASELGDDQPVFGLQARGVADKQETAHECVEEMAREYLAEIRSVQPAGPYRLCGSSFGGLVAFEAARQLRKSGEDVEILALFDTYAPGYLKQNAAKMSGLGNMLQRTINIRNQILEIRTARARAVFLLSRIEKLRVRLKRRFLWKKNQFSIQYGKATGKELPADILRNHKAIEKALQTYYPTGYDGKVTLFRASEQPKNVDADLYLGWAKFTTGEIIAEDVKGSHGALTVYPFAKHLADKFLPYLIDTKTNGNRYPSSVA